MACRKHSPGKPCCNTMPDCSDLTQLPLTFTFESNTINRTFTASPDARLNWSGFGSTDGCCWYANYPYIGGIAPINSICSTEATIAGTLRNKLVAVYIIVSTTVIIGKMTNQCDAQPSPVSQYTVEIQKTYQGFYADVNYNTPSPSCSALAQQVLFWAGTNLAAPFQWKITRRGYYAALPTGSYILTPTSLAVCTPVCGGISDFSLNTITIPPSGGNLLGQSVTLDDTSDWTFDTTN